MRSKEETRLVIIDNLETFSDNLLSLIAEASEKGIELFIDIIEKAKHHYKKPIDSWTTGWIYQYTRLRVPQVDETIDNLYSFPDAVTLLQEFKKLVQTGEWNKGSFNHCLFKEMIQAIPGYKPLEPELYDKVILRLRELLISRVDQFIINYKLNQKLMRERDKEFKETKSLRKKTVESIELLSDLKTIPNKLTGKSWFCLNQVDSRWKLQWLDPTGTALALQPTPILLNILTQNKLTDIKNLTLHVSLEIQNECVKARNELLEKIKIFINPKELSNLNPVELLELDTEKLLKILNPDTINLGRDLTSSYVLLSNKKLDNTTCYFLIWVNRFGKKQAISLDNYPQLKEWLKTQTELDEHQLKMHLAGVKTNKPLEMTDFKKELSFCLTGVKEVPTKESSAETGVQAKDIPKIGKLNIGLFKAVEDCLSQTHVRHTTIDEEEKILVTKPLKTPGKLNLNHFAIAQQLGHESKPLERENTPEI